MTSPNTTTSSPSPRIAIIGAGPAGLTLARILQKHSISATVFEKDPSSAHRATAGGSLDLHEAAGQAALREAGLWDEFQRLARYDSQAYIIADERGHQYININDLDLGRPEIDRPQLRRMMLESLEEGTVRWGHKLQRVDPDGTLVFEGPPQGEEGGGGGGRGGRATVVKEKGFGLVVGADGAWSKVRARLCPVPPFYAGIAGYEMWIHDPDGACPDVSALAGEGSHFAFGTGGGDERGLCLQRQSDRSLQLYAYMRKPEDWHAANGVADHGDPAEVKALMLREYGAWAPGYRRALAAVNGVVIPRSLYMMHVGTRWLHKKGFTLVGDAAHLMTPFAGEGVNQAMHDALSLAAEIVKSPADVDAAAAAYERDMFPRAAAFQQATWESLQERYEPRGNEKFAEELRKVAEEIKAGSGSKDGSRPDTLFNKE